jgi:ribosomal protein L40E
MPAIWASPLRAISRLLTSILLLWSMIPLFFAQTAMSAQLTTLTSYAAITGTSSSLEYYSQATTLVKTTGFTSSFTVTYNVGSGRSSCLVGIMMFPFNITRSQTVHVDFPATLPTDIAIFNEASFFAWTMNAQCYFWLYFSKSDVTSGSYDVNLNPGNGGDIKLNNPYWLIFLHRGSALPPKIRVAVNGLLLEQPTFVTLTNTHLITNTRTATSLHYSTLQSPIDQVRSPMSLLAIGIAAGILIVAAIVVIPKRQKRPAARKPTKLSEAKQEKRFCINCGAELPPNSEFCNKCGTAQA